MQFPEALRSLRRQAHLTQAQLGERAGVSQHAVSQYELGERSPDATITIKLGNALSLPVMESVAWLALAGFATEKWRDRASRDLEAYLEGTQKEAPGESEDP